MRTSTQSSATSLLLHLSAASAPITSTRDGAWTRSYLHSPGTYLAREEPGLGEVTADVVVRDFRHFPDRHAAPPVVSDGSRRARQRSDLPREPISHRRGARSPHLSLLVIDITDRGSA